MGLEPLNRPEDASIREPVRDKDRLMLVLAYLGVLALVPLLLAKDSGYVQWHARQGLVLGVGGGLLMSVVSAVPVVGFFTCLLGPVIVVLDVVAMVKSFRGERWRVPGAAYLADRL